MNDETTDLELIVHALNMWANYIETGDLVLSAQDVKNMMSADKIKSLSLEQIKIVVRLRELAKSVGVELPKKITETWE